MRFPRVVEAWMYSDPAEIADALVARTLRIETPRPVQASASVERDRYYTMARRAEVRLHVKRVMKGKR